MPYIDARGCQHRAAVTPISTPGVRTAVKGGGIWWLPFKTTPLFEDRKRSLNHALPR
jgi:hypothetical protein